MSASSGCLGRELLSSSHYPWLAVDPNTAGGATGSHMARCGRETRFGVSSWIRLRALAVLALCGVPFAGVHAVRPIRAQQEVLRASLSGGVALANGTRGGDDAGHPAVDARGKIACAEGDEPIELRWPEGWTRTTHEQRERALSPSFPGPDTDTLETSDERDVITNAASSSRRLLLKLAPLVLGEKDTLIVGAVGGSVTLGDTRRPDLAYPALFAAGLTEALANRAGEGRRKRDVSVAAVNGAMGGTGSGYFALCINRHLSMDADIVLVELNVNDGTDRSFERVHRKILDRAGRPAVLDVLAEIWKEKMVEDREDSDARRSDAHPGVFFSRAFVTRLGAALGARRRRVPPVPLFPLPLLRPLLQRTQCVGFVRGRWWTFPAVVRVPERGAERIEEPKRLRRLVLRRGTRRVDVPRSFRYLIFVFVFLFLFVFFPRRRVRFFRFGRRAGQFVRDLGYVGVFRRSVLAGLRLAVRARRARRRRRRVARGARLRVQRGDRLRDARLLGLKLADFAEKRVAARRRGPRGILHRLRRARGGGDRRREALARDARRLGGVAGGNARRGLGRHGGARRHRNRWRHRRRRRLSMAVADRRCGAVRRLGARRVPATRNSGISARL